MSCSAKGKHAAYNKKGLRFQEITESCYGKNNSVLATWKTLERGRSCNIGQSL